ncbi:MAG TPA: hypothetical protein VFR78_04365 [Pyrinomonadaceae bacterium]|nr:hypothetical protein [Pyrinomonadaceae bacterium]
MRRFTLVVLVAFLCMFAACSFTTNFVIVNESDSPVIVRYEIKEFHGEFYLPDKPVVVAASELGEDQPEWKPIEFEVDEATRSVTTQLMPGEALRIARLNSYMGHDNPNSAHHFQIRTITISGARGQLNLTDEQARTTFTEVSLSLYTLTYK